MQRIVDRRNKRLPVAVINIKFDVVAQTLQ